MQKKVSFGFKKLFYQPYKYGFFTKIPKENFPKGINLQTINKITNINNEPEFLYEFRKNSYELWVSMEQPRWANLKLKPLNLKNFLFYSAPLTSSLQSIKQQNKSSFQIFNTFKKLGINLTEKKENENRAVDAVFDSVSVKSTHTNFLGKHGIIFCSITSACKNYPSIIQKYLGKVVSQKDNYFASLNSAVFSDGSFGYIPQNTICPLELSSYFRINNTKMAQFERTLIIAEKNSSVHYFEGCSAPASKNNQLHAAVVELISFENAIINYSTVQNWYDGNKRGLGGVYNFVTKRGLCLGHNSSISWNQIEKGAAITWKYPSCILLGKESSGNFQSIALTKNYQQADTGTKMIHIGSNTTSKIVSKSISADNSISIYRGLVRFAPAALFSRNYSQCDSLQLNLKANVLAIPHFEIFNSYSILEHEATISKISADQLFYLNQRGIEFESAINLLIHGYCRDFLTTLSPEYAIDAKNILTLY